MTYTPVQVKDARAVTATPINVTRFFDMRGEKTGLMTPESRKRKVAGILCNEDLGNWVTNATLKELQARGYSAKAANAVDAQSGEYVIGGSVHMVEYERGGRGFYFKILLDVNLTRDSVVILHRQYFNSVKGKPTLPGTPKSFEKGLRKALGDMIADVEPLLTRYEGKQT
jgi:hypothetical protein